MGRYTYGWKGCGSDLWMLNSGNQVHMKVYIIQYISQIYRTILDFNSSTVYCLEWVKISSPSLPKHVWSFVFLPVSDVVVDLSKELYKMYLHFFYIFFTLRGTIYLKLSWWTRTRKLIFDSQYHGCWCFIQVRSQGIRGQVCLEYFGFSIKRPRFFGSLEKLSPLADLWSCRQTCDRPLSKPMMIIDNTWRDLTSMG